MYERYHKKTGAWSAEFRQKVCMFLLVNIIIMSYMRGERDFWIFKTLGQV